MIEPVLKDEFPTTSTPANTPVHFCTRQLLAFAKETTYGRNGPSTDQRLVPAPIIPRHTLGMCLTTSRRNMREFYDT